MHTNPDIASPAEAFGQPKATAGPAPELYPGHAEELRQRNQRAVRSAGAASAPLPGPLRDAWAGIPPKLHGFTFQPVRLRLHCLLTGLDSPLLDAVRIMREELVRDNGSDDSTPKARQAADKARMKRIDARIKKEITNIPAMMDTVYAFTQPPGDLERLLARGREEFHETAAAALDHLTPEQFHELTEAAAAWFMASFATKVQFEPKPQEGGTVFTPPPAELKTGSAGGSNSTEP